MEDMKMDAVISKVRKLMLRLLKGLIPTVLRFNFFNE